MKVLIIGSGGREHALSAGEEASAYYAAARLPDTIGLLVGGGVLANAMVPVLVRVYQRTGSPQAIAKLMGSVLSALMVIVIPIALLIALWLQRENLAPSFQRGATSASTNCWNS